MNNTAKRSLPADLVVVRGAELAAMHSLIEALNNSADDTGCQDGLTVIDGGPLRLLVTAAAGLKTKPLMDSLRMLQPASEHLDRLMLVVPPEVTIEEACRQVVCASDAVTEGLSDAEDPDQDAFIAEVSARGLCVGANIQDLGIGAWDEPSGELAQGAGGEEPEEGDTVFVVIQEGGATGELYTSSWPTREEAEAFRFNCRDEGSYRTSPVIEVARALAREPFYEVVEQFMRSAVLELSYPEGEAPASEGGDEDESGTQPRGERNGQ